MFVTWPTNTGELFWVTKPAVGSDTELCVYE